MPKIKDVNHYNWQYTLILGTLAHFSHFRHFYFSLLFPPGDRVSTGPQEQLPAGRH